MSPTCRLQNFSRKGIDVTLTNVQLNSGKGKKKNGKLKEKKFRILVNLANFCQYYFSKCNNNPTITKST